MVFYRAFEDGFYGRLGRGGPRRPAQHAFFLTITITLIAVPLNAVFLKLHGHKPLEREHAMATAGGNRAVSSRQYRLRDSPLKMETGAPSAGPEGWHPGA